jgi:hypothetical protein
MSEDTDLGSQTNADPDPGSQTNKDPDPESQLMQIRILNIKKKNFDSESS